MLSIPYCCWRPGDSRSQVISSICSEYSGFSTTRVLTVMIYFSSGAFFYSFIDSILCLSFISEIHLNSFWPGGSGLKTFIEINCLHSYLKMIMVTLIKILWHSGQLCWWWPTYAVINWTPMMNANEFVVCVSVGLPEIFQYATNLASNLNRINQFLWISQDRDEHDKFRPIPPIHCHENAWKVHIWSVSLSQNGAKMRKTNRPWPKFNQFKRWSGCISMSNFRPFLPCILKKILEPPNLTCFTKSKWHQNEGYQ